MLARRTFSRLFLAAFFVATFAVVIPTATFAQGADITGGLQTVGTTAGISGGGDIYSIIGNIINIVLGLLGTVLLVIMLYAGYEWMTSGGDSEKVESAKVRLRNAIIGLIIIMTSFAITNFILNALISATGSGSGTTSGTGSGGVGGLGGLVFPHRAGALGGGIIESHVPGRNATDVPRNTSIVISFKEPIKISSFIRDYNDHGTPADLTDDTEAAATTGINNDNIKVYVTRDGVTTALATGDARVRFTPDRQTFIIKPIDYLGNATANALYTVALTTGIKLGDGNDTNAFDSRSPDGYSWEFEVSTVVDLTPPQVVSVIPRADRSYKPNIVVQITFNEAIDPTSAQGTWTGDSGFANLQVAATPQTPAGAPTARPHGEFRISNQYRTVEFLTDLACGTNSCGRTVYCLPSVSTIAVKALSPTLSAAVPPPQAELTASGYDGIVDMAGNALDGNKNGDAEGPVVDSYSWSFVTTDAPDLTAPTLRSTSPATSGLGTSNVPIDQNPEALFSGLLQSSTVNSDNVIMRTNEPADLADTFWWSVSQDFLSAVGSPVGGDPENSNVKIAHRLYTQATTVFPTPIYQPKLKSGIQNVYQNCFNPTSASCSSPSAGPDCCDGVAQNGVCLAP